MIVFDDIHLTAFTAHRGQGRGAEFLSTGTREGDRVTLLVATGGGAGGARAWRRAATS